MPTKEETQETIRAIIVAELGCDDAEVTPKARFIGDLGCDSLDTVEIAMRFEEEFGFEIPDEDMEKIETVQQAYDYVREKACGTDEVKSLASGEPRE